MKDECTALLNIVNSVNTGLINEADYNPKIVEALVNAWPHLSGSEDQNTTSDKLYRAEKIKVEGDCISFILERHGRTVNGSKRASMHYWQVDTKSMSATIIKEGYRNLEKNSPRMDTGKMAETIFVLINECKEDPQIEWKEKFTRVKVNIAKVIPDDVKETTNNRRRRFREALNKKLEEKGWKMTNYNNYIKEDSSL